MTMAADNGVFRLEFPDGYDRWDFDRPYVKSVMRTVGKDLKANTQRVLRRGGRSKPGEAPTKRYGIYAKAIVSRVSKSGLSVGISPTRKTLLRALVSGLPPQVRKGFALKDFYPAPLVERKGGRGVRLSPVMVALKIRRNAYLRYFADHLGGAIVREKSK